MQRHPNRSRTAGKALTAAIKKAHDHRHDYSGLLEGVRRSFEQTTANGIGPLFQTDAGGLYDLYLNSLPSERQVHSCKACRHFLEKFGGLVHISENGSTTSAMWSQYDSPAFYKETFASLKKEVEKARITGVFYSVEKILGTPVTGEWSHMSVVQPSFMVHNMQSLTATQAAAAVKENFRTVAAALADFKPPVLNEALRALNAGTLSRSERFVAPIAWLRALHARPKGRAGENVLWLAVATAPEGFCHPRASIVGSLLEDILSGLPFPDVRDRFNAKMHPTLYQRPQSAPSTGNIKMAETLVAKLGIKCSLERRFARISEMKSFIWKPQAKPELQNSSIFEHLKAKNKEQIKPLDLPATTMTWEKFSKTVLPLVQEIQIHIPISGAFIALTTAVHSDAPPILKWDFEEDRNPVAWYVHPIGHAIRWNLHAGEWSNITGIVPFPTTWGKVKMPEIADGAILIIEDAVDELIAGNAIFPETLKNDLHKIRSTIEAFSKSASLSGREDASACGYELRKNSPSSCILRADGTIYKIDRWD